MATGYMHVERIPDEACDKTTPAAGLYVVCANGVTQ